MRPLFDAILQHVPQRDDDPNAPLQMQIISLDYSSYVGKIGVGRINRGRMRPGMEIAYKFGPEGQGGRGRINQVLKFHGLERVVVDEAEAGDIVLINGIEEIGIGSTVMDPVAQEPLPMLRIDEPTLTMNFMVNTSPLAGREGKFVTSRQLRDRLDRELKSNVALRVRDTGDDTVFEVSGRGELHLTILLETMRREGYELAVPRPRVVFKEIDGVKCEPFESLTIDVEDAHQGGVMEELGRRKGDLQDMQPDGRGRTRLEYLIPARGLIGFQNEFLTLTRGTGLMSHIFHEYAPIKEGSIGERRNGVLISQDNGDAVAYALWKLQDRGRMFVNPRSAVRRHDHRHPQPRQRPGREPDQGQAADQRARLRHGRSGAPGAADPDVAGIRRRIHRRRRTGRTDARRSACASATCKSTSASAPPANRRCKHGAGPGPRCASRVGRGRENAP